jgi:photosystem II stability/assembly factor-like uncharacterized protein
MRGNEGIDVHPSILQRRRPACGLSVVLPKRTESFRKLPPTEPCNAIAEQQIAGVNAMAPRAARGLVVMGAGAVMLATAACGTQVPAQDADRLQRAAATAGASTSPAAATPTTRPTAETTPMVEATPMADASPPAKQSSGRVRVVDASRLTADDGWVLTHRSLLVTHDSGGSWTEVTPPDRVGAIVGVHFPSPEEGYVAERDYDDLDGTLTVHHTSDGGASWQSLVVDPHDYIQPLRVSFSFPTAELGFAAVRLESGGAFSYASLLRTTDGGTTWEVVGDAPAASGVTFLDASTGWLVGGPTGISDLFATGDGGRTWNKIGPARPFAGNDTRMGYRAPIVIDDLVMVPVTMTRGAQVSEEFFVTSTATAARQEWSRVASVRLPPSHGRGASLAVAAPARDSFLSATGDQGRLVRATAAGQAEVVSASGLPVGVNRLDFPTPLHGWAVVQNDVCSGTKESPVCISTEALFATEDGGANWHDLTPPAQE